MLTRRQFDILDHLVMHEAGSQRDLARLLGLSVGTVNRHIRELTDLGFVRGGSITPAGVDELEPYHVRRALIIGAGFGSRMVPITLNTPKPLVRVNGKRIVDTMIDALHGAGITDITLVRGYLSEQFDQLLYQYPDLKFRQNPLFNEANTISSVLQVTDLIENAYICEADLLVRNPSIIRPYQYQSNYLGVYTQRTDDWCLIPDQKGYARRMTQGGTNCYHMYGVSFWTAEDGSRLAQRLQDLWQMPGGHERFFDNAVFDVFPQDFNLLIRPCQPEDIIEIDTFRELKAIDKSYDI